MEKIYYKISEVSEMLQVPASKLRYWEKVIPQLNPHKQAGKTRRFYTPENVELLRRIKFLREEQNMPVEVVIATLNASASDVDMRLETISLLQQLKTELTEIRSKI
ncbi:MAG: MerR family transcriptional regulator [Paludibacteraceae bacterium]|nr:MerR family transcriptional regulator [Paludibacteraceae bacterium]